jgi:hypothetical protein
MANWIERVDRATDPAILNEHALRYRFAAPLIESSAVWGDLGCGTGAAAAQAVGRFNGRLVLVELDVGALQAAAREQIGAEVVAVHADLSVPSDLMRVRDALVGDDSAGSGCLTCFEIIEHLVDFVPLVTLLAELAEEGRFTVALSVPNDAFTGVENPYHRTVWGESAAEELRRLVPEPIVAHQYALAGSCVQQLSDEAATYDAFVEVSSERVPTHHILVFGPRVREVAPVFSVVQADLATSRRVETAREADLEYFRRIAEDAGALRTADKAETARISEKS